MFGGRKRAEGHARRKTISGDVEQRDNEGMEWFDIDLLKDDVDLGEKDEKQSRFFDIDGEIGDGLKMILKRLRAGWDGVS
ncbi:uncharacterized protein J4E79_009370 [Alternaria viburni]|uniref:uncharacterized protein n=1 Tax=Alternaria viburni TaxID=566460 RepID=UPI0020C584E5|nr:uncharacterized protein J4E79_009370 [Alternaria viburni]KAI4651171.1 hypothetical protein J4E79_009370 [Alternaria viburni]